LSQSFTARSCRCSSPATFPDVRWRAVCKIDGQKSDLQCVPAARWWPMLRRSSQVTVLSTSNARYRAASMRTPAGMIPRTNGAAGPVKDRHRGRRSRINAFMDTATASAAIRCFQTVEDLQCRRILKLGCQKRRNGHRIPTRRDQKRFTHIQRACGEKQIP